MTWKERRTLTLLASILAVLFAALLVVLGIRFRENRQNPADGGDGGSALPAGAVSRAAEGITSLSYENGSASLSFALGEDGRWIWSDDPGFPLDPENLTAIVELVSDLHFQQTLAAAEGLESYGLDKPRAFLTASRGNGVTQTLAFGKDTTDGTSCYLMMNGDESTVYTIDGGLLQRLRTPIYDMYALPELPELSEGLLQSLRIQGPAPQEEGAQPLVLELLSRQSQEGQVTVWYQGSDNVTDRQRLKDLLADLRWSLTLTRCVDYRPSDEAASICGFDAPRAVLTVGLGEERTFTVTVGAAVSEGCYIRLDDDSTIYLTPAEAVDSLLEMASAGLDG